MLPARHTSIAALLVLSMFSTVLGQPSDCTASCAAQGCLSGASAAKSCCGSCGTGGACQCKKETNGSAKSCCSNSNTLAAKSCCTPKVPANNAAPATNVPSCDANCPCARSNEFPPVPLEQQSKLADSLKLPVMDLGPVLAVLPAAHELSSGYSLPDDSPPPRAGHGLRIWICSWTI